MSCRTCLRYGHTVKTCHETIVTCARCNCQGHNQDKGTSTEVRCCHCWDDHQTFSRNCAMFRKEIEIVQTQTKERIPRLPVIRKLLRKNSHPELVFSNTVMNTSNQTISKSPTRTNQESQSEYTEGNSPPVPSCGYGYYIEGKGKKKRSPPSPTLTVGSVRRKIPRK